MNIEFLNLLKSQEAAKAERKKIEEMNQFGL
jgi:hypothetical protein